MNAQAGYRFSPRLSVMASVFNLFDAEASDISYFYESRCRTNRCPSPDIHFHPAGPRTLRVAADRSF
ncbi:MAG: TonB-dependent receptor [Proteobacteria bacterium]|nr:TonB-dependent receptor [Pseudomonadota bacterium]